MRGQTSRSSVVVGIAAVQLLAIGLWAAGLLTLGAVVAPIVFRAVPAPASADAMTQVFARFDRVAIACAAVALVAEGVLVVRSSARFTRTDGLRTACLVAATVLAVLIGLWFSPGIAAFHRGGAVRRIGDEGQALDRMHRLAETLAKGEVVLLVVAFLLTVAKTHRGDDDGTRAAKEPL